jgi:hypothetical protein
LLETRSIMPDVRTSKILLLPRSRRGRLWAAGLLAALSASPASPAAAQPRPAAAAGPRAPARGGPVEGTVVAIQGEEIVLDLGTARGAADGATVELWRPVKLKHPVTGKVLTDRFRIGALELVQVRGSLSLARASGALSHPADVGDVVVLAGVFEAPAPSAPDPRSPAEPERPSAPASTDEKPAAPEDPDARAVTEMFDALRGADLWTRVARYEDYVQHRAAGRFARVLTEEAAALRELLGTRGKVQAEQARPESRNFTAPEEALAGAPLRIAIQMNDATTGAVLHVRRHGAASYASLPMSPLGNGYFSASIAAAQVVSPSLDYFIEGFTGSGKAYAVQGSAESPRDLEVFEPPRPTAPRHIPARVELAVDYADWNRLRGNDKVLQTEGWFGVRYGDTGVRALRLGFGIYRGVGGSVDELDRQMLAGRSVGLTYGYLETEIGFVRAFSVIGRAAVGLIDRGISGGGQVLLRIGSDQKTNLLLGGELLGGVGVRGITQLELNTFERVPIVLRTEVTNQPAGVTPSAADAKTSGGSGDIGGRGIVQVGFRVVPDLVIAVRGSFQGRTIQHAGPGVGGAVGYQW